MAICWIGGSERSPALAHGQPLASLVMITSVAICIRPVMPAV